MKSERRIAIIFLAFLFPVAACSTFESILENRSNTIGGQFEERRPASSDGTTVTPTLAVDTPTSEPTTTPYDTMPTGTPQRTQASPTPIQPTSTNLPTLAPTQSDTTAPEILEVVANPVEGKSGQWTTITAKVDDEGGSGLALVLISYLPCFDAITSEIQPMHRVGNYWERDLFWNTYYFPPPCTVEYRIIAHDNAGNFSQTGLLYYEVR